MAMKDSLQHGGGYRGVDDLLGCLGAVQSRRRRLIACSGLAWALTAVAVALLAVSMLGYWPGQPPAAVRWGAFAVLLAVCGGAAGLLVARVRRSKFRPAQAARFIEQSQPEVRNDLINSVLLAQDATQPSPQLVQRAIDECRFRISQADLGRSCIPLRRAAKNHAIAAAVALALLGIFATLQPGPFARGLVVATQPGSYVPANNSLELQALTPGDAKLFPGEPMTISLAVLAKNPAGAEGLSAEVVIVGLANPRAMLAETQQAGQGKLRPLREKTTKKFQAVLGPVYQPMRYFVRATGPAGGGRWPADRPWFTVDIRDLAIENFSVRYVYPAYTGLAERVAKLTSQAGGIEAPLGSRATIQLRFAEPVPRGHIEFRTGKREAMLARDGGRVHVATFPINAAGGYKLVFADRAGRLLRQLPSQAGKGASADGYYDIVAKPDRPPAVAFVKPGRDVTLPAGAKLRLKIRASDDFGLTGLSLQAGKQGQTSARVESFQPGQLLGKTQAIATHELELAGYAPGEQLIYYVVATDNRRLKSPPGPQQTRSKSFRVTIARAEAIDAQRAAMLARLQKQLMEILRQQVRQRLNTALAWRANTLDRSRKLGAEILAGQRSIQAGLEQVAEVLRADKTPPSEQADQIKRVAIALANNEAPLAVDQAAVLSKLARLADSRASCESLGLTQGRIVRVLQELLAMLPSFSKALEQASETPGSDLTPELRREMREKLAEDLQRFLAEQKKIIQASRRLTKKNVDDFSQADEKLLRDLVALEDKWEKFMNEAFTDFSKLAQQDFSTPSMLKELIAVKCDITMAKDALTAKAVEIATAAEESSVENAETLTANIEKWLPDEPDRKKWNMEALEEQQNTEMAELSGELEDLIGDLLEEEEDLFEEMDDLSSKSTMSGDKGIGWDAMDGPISNMNAQGVTGNQLPNTSEISGRSGEGRTGKAAGEFVEDKAVGKGGRRTPSRLSHDPFQKGQIKDVSTEPPGGATGGGKLSGAGAEGLEGPSPAELGRQLKALAGKQAAIVNRAERLNARFRPGSYASFRLRQSILLMNRVQADLERGQYRNALRQRAGLAGTLRATRDMLGRDSQIEVAQDAAKPMPKHLRKNISDASGSKLPANYSEILKQYYRRLGENRRVGK